MSSSSVHSKTPILFVNYKEERCGVYQYGINIFEAISKSQRYVFQWAEVLSLEEMDAVIAQSNCRAIIFNYHPHTLTFINPDMPRRYKQINIGLMHEMHQVEADRVPGSFFQHYIMGDPTLVENNPGVFKTGRLVLPYTNTKPLPDTVTIGTLGFSVGSKGYQKLVDLVQEEFDEAIIRMHIPANGIIDGDGALARQFLAECEQRIRKPGIKLQPSHEFLDRQGMLDFLAENTLNAFLYDDVPFMAIASSPDHAIAVRRPMVITKSILFRHLHSLYPPITIEDSSLREIIKNGIAPFSHLYKLWTGDNIRREYENVLDKALDSNHCADFTARSSRNDVKTYEIHDFDYKAISRRYKSRGAVLRRGKDKVKAAIAKEVLARAPRLFEVRGVKRFNRILDNQARAQYKGAITQLHLLAPEIMVSKIPAANIQQAFIFDAVKRFTPANASPRILCVGSYDDSASASLKKLGYPVEEIDPEVNNLDLNAFFHLPSTKKGSYDIVFSTSVIEHVEDDELFVKQMAELLAPGGVGLLTCDYNDLHKPGDPVMPGDCRFYTQKDLVCRILPALKDCSLLDVPHWECHHPDFEFVGYRYTFATLAFKKNNGEVMDA